MMKQAEKEKKKVQAQVAKTTTKLPSLGIDTMGALGSIGSALPFGFGSKKAAAATEPKDTAPDATDA